MMTLTGLTNEITEILAARPMDDHPDDRARLELAAALISSVAHRGLGKIEPWGFTTDETGLAITAGTERVVCLPLGSRFLDEEIRVKEDLNRWDGFTEPTDRIKKFQAAHGLA